jgi:hypothetical protein
MKLPPSWTLPATIKGRFGQRSAGKQRAMIAEGHLLLVLHQAPVPHQRDRTAILFWRSPAGHWKTSQGKAGFPALLKYLQDYTTQEENLRQIYLQATCAEDYFRLLEGMTPLRLAVTNLHDAFQAAREGIPDDPNLIDLRDWAYETERTLDLLYENTKNAMNFSMARRAEEQTQLSISALESSDRLNILAAVFLPITAISSVFGMNLVSGVEQSHLITLWSVLVVGIVLGFAVRRWVVKGRWL